MKIVIKLTRGSLILKNWNQRFSDSEKIQNTGAGGSWISKFFKRPKPEV
jgi:hypothetical protein